MEQYTTSIKDLVILPLSNGSEIKAEVERGDALGMLSDMFETFVSFIFSSMLLSLSKFNIK